MGIGKIVVGLVLIVASLYYIGTNMFGAFEHLIVVVNGALPLLILILGLMVVWLQLDEIMMEKKVSKRRK